MGGLPLASEALLSKYSFVSAGAFVGFGRLAALFFSSCSQKGSCNLAWAAPYFGQCCVRGRAEIQSQGAYAALGC